MPVGKKHIAIVCNPLAGNGKALQVANKIVLLIKNKEISFSLFTAEWPEVWNGITQVWIVGGDGTLNYFINQYPDLKIPLSIFKGGTGNDFHELLYGAINPEEQIEKLLKGSAHFVDAGICNKKLFLNGIGIGFDGAIVKDLISKKKSNGKSAYLISILKNILGYKEKKCSITFDGRTISQDCFMINIANGKAYGGGFKVAPKANIEDGLLDLNIVGEIASFKRFYYIPVIEKGKHLDLPFIQYHHTKKVEINFVEALPAHMDGEFFNSNHFIIECLPKRFSFLW
jgi:YegS/Rv2252/BmrU family lipid kinase